MKKSWKKLLRLHLFLLLGLLAATAWGQQQKPVVIVAFGTSFTAGLGVPQNEAYPARLEAMLKAAGENVLVKNEGQSGNTTRNLLGRFDYAIGPDTDIVVMDYSLVNDAREGIPLDETLANCERIFYRLKERGIPTLLIVRGRDHTQVSERLGWFQKMIEKYRLQHLDLEQPEASLWDRLHPNVRAHAYIAVYLAAPVWEMIDQVRKGEKAAAR